MLILVNIWYTIKNSEHAFILNAYKGIKYRQQYHIRCWHLCKIIGEYPFNLHSPSPYTVRKYSGSWYSDIIVSECCQQIESHDLLTHFTHSLILLCNLYKTYYSCFFTPKDFPPLVHRFSPKQLTTSCLYEVNF